MSIGPPPPLFKLSGSRNTEWRCMFCCHVRTGTIFLGLWHLMLQLLAISTLGMVLRHPELLKPIQITRTSVENNGLPTALAEHNIPILNLDSVSTDNTVFSNYDQEDMFEPAIGGAKNGDYYATYGMFIGRPLRYGKLIFKSIY